MSNRCFPAGLLYNTTTSRYHPIVFYAAPKPSETGEIVVRHRSRGNHIEGFETLEAARQFLAEQDTWRPYDVVWAWDGSGVPALVFWFPLTQGEGS